MLNTFRSYFGISTKTIRDVILEDMSGAIDEGKTKKIHQG